MRYRESGSMADEQWAKMVVLGHGVRERSGGGSLMSEDGSA